MGQLSKKNNNPLVNPFENIEDGDNAKYLTTALQVADIGRVRVDLTDADATAERITEYFNLMIEKDQKPTMTGLAMCLGINHQRMSEIRRNVPSGLGKLPSYGYTTSFASPEVREIIEKAVAIMTNLWEDYMQNGKINPASGIFLGKNFYGMKDQVEHVVTAQTNPIDDYSVDDIASRYLKG